MMLSRNKTSNIMPNVKYQKAQIQDQDQSNQSKSSHDYKYQCVKRNNRAIELEMHSGLFTLLLLLPPVRVGFMVLLPILATLAMMHVTVAIMLWLVWIST